MGYDVRVTFTAARCRYLIPQAHKDSGTSKDNVIFSDGVIERVNSAYCRESGVRNLKKHVEQIIRKAAFRIVRDKESPVVVTVDNLKQFVGVEKFSRDREYAVTPPGVAMGLAYTSHGGAALYIETISTKGETDKAGFKVTGSLGDVMRESTQISYTYAMKHLQQLQPENDFFHKADISLHIPEGAVPKVRRLTETRPPSQRHIHASTNKCITARLIPPPGAL